MKNHYECTFIINHSLDDAQIESTIRLAEDTIAKNGGAVVNTDRIGRRRLAYTIAKKNSGFYVAIEFEAESRSIEKVERFLTLDENVIRYMTLKLSKRDLEAKRNRAAAVLAAAKALEEAKDAVEAAPEKDKK
jgi:small subunit ribosomal protein S6